MMIFTDALPAVAAAAAVPPTPSASNSALPRRRDIQGGPQGTYDAQDGRHANSAPLAGPPHALVGLGTVAQGRPPSPYVGAGTIVAMQWVVFGSCVLRWLVF